MLARVVVYVLVIAVVLLLSGCAISTGTSENTASACGTCRATNCAADGAVPGSKELVIVPETLWFCTDYQPVLDADLLRSRAITRQLGTIRDVAIYTDWWTEGAHWGKVGPFASNPISSYPERDAARGAEVRLEALRDALKAGLANARYVSLLQDRVEFDLEKYWLDRTSVWALAVLAVHLRYDERDSPLIGRVYLVCVHPYSKGGPWSETDQRIGILSSTDSRCLLLFRKADSEALSAALLQMGVTQR